MECTECDFKFVKQAKVNGDFMLKKQCFKCGQCEGKTFKFDLMISENTQTPHLPQNAVIGCFSLEREELNPFVKPTNKHGNNGGSYQSGRKPRRWIEKKFIENVTEEYAVNFWNCYTTDEGWRIVNWNNGEIVAGGQSRF